MVELVWLVVSCDTPESVIFPSSSILYLTAWFSNLIPVGSLPCRPQAFHIFSLPTNLTQALYPSKQSSLFTDWPQPTLLSLTFSWVKEAQPGSGLQKSGDLPSPHHVRASFDNIPAEWSCLISVPSSGNFAVTQLTSVQDRFKHVAVLSHFCFFVYTNVKLSSLKTPSPLLVFTPSFKSWLSCYFHCGEWLWRSDHRTWTKDCAVVTREGQMTNISGMMD